MKQLLILSGKGGTGKTTVAGAFIKFAAARAYADCDVDAPNLHLVMRQSKAPVRTDYFGLPKSLIDTEKCIGCDKCRQHCRFDAIKVDEKGRYEVDAFACEGCGVCEFVCPVSAITMYPAKAGDLMLYTDDAVFSTAQLLMGSGTSGKLVTEVKNQLKTAAGDAELAIVDGSPGIGCPVIASLSGVDMVLVVAEPSVSGISDMERIIKTAGIFGVKVTVCINKCDTNLKNSGVIELFCLERNIPFAGRIPFDPDVVRVTNAGLSIADADCVSGRAAKGVFDRTMELLMAES